MNSQNPSKTFHRRVFSIANEISKSTVPDQVALRFFRNLIPQALIASFGVAKRWNHISESRKNIAIVNQFKKKLRDKKLRIPILHSRLGGRESTKTRIDANTIIGGPVNANART